MNRSIKPTTGPPRQTDETPHLLIVALGDSAGDLAAVRQLLNVIPADTGCAFALIQPHEPTHKSTMVDLLAGETKMTVVEAADGMALGSNCLYVIPPKQFLSVRDGMLRLSKSENQRLEAAHEALQERNKELGTSYAQLEDNLAQCNKTANDLQNILICSDIATLYLDAGLNVRYFTPAAAPLFNLRHADIGGSLADLSVSFTGIDLIADARQVLAGRVAIKRNVANSKGQWFLCSMSPYYTQDDKIDGVVVNLADISDLKVAKKKAELANSGKSRFLAATSHNLRQPLQTLSLLLGALKGQIEGEKALALLARAQTSQGVMTSMLDTLLDIGQLEAGVITPKFTSFPINEILDALREEFAEQMAVKGLKWRVVPCGLTVYSDRILLADMVRNLISNALRYTDTGSVLLGCRRRKDQITIAVWDTGIGIADDKLPLVFDDYFRAADRPADGSYGLGLSIAHQIGDLLSNPLNVRSWLGKGSVFSIEAPRTYGAKIGLARTTGPIAGGDAGRAAADATDATDGTATIYVVEDDRAPREAMQALLELAGYAVEIFADAAAFLAYYQPGSKGCVITDVRMPDMTGFELLAQIGAMGDGLPTIVVTGQGDIAMAVQAIRAGAVDFIEKPTAPDALLAAVDRALQQAASPAEKSASQQVAASLFAGLTKRERQVAQLVVAGHPNKEVAAKLGISQRTVETHRAAAMKKLGAESISELVRLEMTAQGY